MKTVLTSSNITLFYLFLVNYAIIFGKILEKIKLNTKEHSIQKAR